MPPKKFRLSELDAQKYNVSKGLIGALVASKDFERAKGQYDKLFVFLKDKAKVSKAKIPEYKIEVDLVVMDGVRPDFSVEDVKRLVEHFEIQLPSLVRSEVNDRSMIERYDFCARAADILHKCWQGNAENVKSLLDFFLEKGVSIVSENHYNDMLFNATTRYFSDHEFIRALLNTGYFEVNKCFVIQEQMIISAFSLSRSLGNMKLVSVFLEFGADPNFIDKTINADKQLLQRVKSGDLRGGLSMEVPLEQRAKSFTDAAVVIEGFYVKNLRELLDQYYTEASSANDATVSPKNIAPQLIALFEQYLIYKAGSSQEAMIEDSIKWKHGLEARILKCVWENPAIDERDGQVFLEISDLIRIIEAGIGSKYKNLFARLYHKLVVDLESFKLAIIRDFLDFKEGKEFSDERIVHLDQPQESSVIAEDASKKSDATADTVLDDEDDSLASPDSKPQEDDWDQLVEEIGKFNLEDDLDLAEDRAAYESGESEDEEETGMGMSPSWNYAVPGIWSRSSLDQGWNSFSIVDHLDAKKNPVVEELLQSSSELEAGEGFFGSEFEEVDDSLEPDSLLEEECGFFGDMSGIDDSLEEPTLLGKNDGKEFNALEE